MCVNAFAEQLIDINQLHKLFNSLFPNKYSLARIREICERRQVFENRRNYLSPFMDIDAANDETFDITDELSKLRSNTNSPLQRRDSNNNDGIVLNFLSSSVTPYQRASSEIREVSTNPDDLINHVNENLGEIPPVNYFRPQVSVAPAVVITHPDDLPVSNQMSSQFWWLY
jgi:hypothetical protein